MILYCPRHRGNHELSELDAEMLIFTMTLTAGYWATTADLPARLRTRQEYVERWCPMQFLQTTKDNPELREPVRVLLRSADACGLVDWSV